ncbi:MAG: flagellin [Planctomycetes bacterium]|nr:flagellin [Planctomycetota bacterium]MBI3834413.1 flagellin [Planctomycetota bacterium]
MSRINTNVQSLISRRAIGVNNASLNQALERLSTGLRINSGKDDPAGLIASETLRSGIRAISSAIDNANRADTIVSVAEGGLQEVSSLLLELENLVDSSSSTAGLTKQETDANQSQIDSILASIDRLAEATSFGDKKLLNGALAFSTSGVNVNEATGAALDNLNKVQINSAKLPFGSFRNVVVNVVQKSTVALVSAVGAGFGGTIGKDTTIQVRGNFGSETLSFASGTSAASIVSAINSSKELTGVSATASAAAGGSPSIIFQSTSYGADAFVSVSVLQNASTAFTGQGAQVQKNGTDGVITVNGSNAIVNGLDASLRSGALSVDLTLTPTFGGTSGGNTSFQITGGGAVFSISPTVGLSGQESIGLQEVSAAKLGNAGVGFLATLGTGLANDLNSKNFAQAQRVVREAVNQVASLRGRLGAFQKDTLTTTISSLQVARENVTAAESAIRDADFAVETSNLTRAQILVSASTSILQLSNSQPQAALKLLG